jgi:hypothetical protein
LFQEFSIILGRVLLIVIGYDIADGFQDFFDALGIAYDITDGIQDVFDALGIAYLARAASTRDLLGARRRSLIL